MQTEQGEGFGNRGSPVERGERVCPGRGLSQEVPPTCVKACVSSSAALRPDELRGCYAARVGVKTPRDGALPEGALCARG